MGQRFSSNGLEHLREFLFHGKDQQQTDKDLTNTEIVRLLKLVAQDLAKAGRHPIIVAIGGAVNTVLLHSRASTTDVDFFYSTTETTDDIRAIWEAARKVAAKEGLGDQWLNNHTAQFIKEEHVAVLYEQARRQDQKLLDEKGLTVYAAPWDYALTTKIDRLAKVGSKPHDFPDALTYLHEHVLKTGKAVTEGELADWAKKYKCEAADKDLLKKLADEYQKKYKKQGLVLA